MNIDKTCNNLYKIIEYIDKVEVNLCIPHNTQYLDLINKLNDIKLDVIDIEKELRAL